VGEDEIDNKVDAWCGASVEEEANENDETKKFLISPNNLIGGEIGDEFDDGGLQLKIVKAGHFYYYQILLQASQIDGNKFV